MGSEQSRAPNNVQRTSSRNVTEAEVQRALALQKSQFEKKMRDLLRSQAANALATTSTPTSASSSSSGTESQRISYCTTSNVVQGVNERERASYSQIQNNLAQQGVNQRVTYSQAQNANGNHTRAPLYPTLPTNGNEAPRSNCNPQSPVNINVFVNRRYGPDSLPSAPPMPPVRQERPISRSPAPRQTAESADVACTTCKYRYTDKIYNCASGHASCSECMLTHQKCGDCGQTITQMRNITMEEYVMQKRISCPNADEGCSYTIAPGKLERHLQDCPFKEVHCMLPGNICLWKGKLSKLADHFDQFHPDSRGEIDTDRFLQLNNTDKTIQVIRLGSYNFIIHQSTVNNQIFVAAQLIGTKSSASKWCYELHVFKKSEPRRKYVFVDKCFSTRESFDDIVRESACAVLPMTYAKTFDNGSGAVVYKYYIKKEVGGSIDKEERNRDVSCTRRGRGRGRGMGRRGRGAGGHAK